MTKIDISIAITESTDGYRIDLHDFPEDHHPKFNPETLAEALQLAHRFLESKGAL